MVDGASQKAYLSCLRGEADTGIASRRYHQAVLGAPKSRQAIDEPEKYSKQSDDAGAIDGLFTICWAPYFGLGGTSMTSGTLQHFEKAFSSVGWFLPPYAALGFLSAMAAEILGKGDSFGQRDLEDWLALLYGPENLAAMVCSRYPVTPVIADYKETISESIEAHLLGLHHVAVAGLVPVIEGAGRKLLSKRGLSSSGVRGVFSELAKDCKRESVEKNIGATGEIASMMDSFSWFTDNVLYVNSEKYPFIDGTNRHGITHGSFRDSDYGMPINFYKTIGAVDFLAFVSAFRANISWFAPDPTAESEALATYYRKLQVVRAKHGASAAQSGSQGFLSPGPHTTHRAGPQWAVQRDGSLDYDE